MASSVRAPPARTRNIRRVSRNSTAICLPLHRNPPLTEQRAPRASCCYLARGRWRRPRNGAPTAVSLPSSCQHRPATSTARLLAAPSDQHHSPTSTAQLPAPSSDQHRPNQHRAATSTRKPAPRSDQHRALLAVIELRVLKQRRTRPRERTDHGRLVFSEDLHARTTACPVAKRARGVLARSRDVRSRPTAQRTAMITKIFFMAKDPHLIAASNFRDHGID
jgi:hypothetical protein